MQDVIEKLAQRDGCAPGDYRDNGILMCGRCRTPKQAVRELPGPDGERHPRLLPILCQCEAEAFAAAKQRDGQRRFAEWMGEQQARYAISERSYGAYTFARDDGSNRELSGLCRRYVERWEAMKADRMGMLFHGAVGTGKSFYACAIANALLERCVPAAVTNFPRLLNLLQSTRNRQELVDHLQEYQLLVIDDLGVERDSTYAAEQVYHVLDARARSGLPLIVTTNLTMEEMRRPATMQFARIYDRVLEMCPITVQLSGVSRRTGNAQARRARARELLKE